MSVNATNPDIATERAIVTANCLYSWPVAPLIAAVRRKTAASTRTTAITGPETCSIARKVASRAERFRAAMLCSTASTTTIASSTTIPIATTRPKSVSKLIEKPSASIPMNVPNSETTTARLGMIVARRFCKKRNTTTTTRSAASNNVFTTSLIEALTNFVVSRETV